MKWVRQALLVGSLAATGGILPHGSLAGSPGPVVDVTKCGGTSPDLARARLGRDGHLELIVRSRTSGARVQVALRRPASLAGKDRLVLEGRGEESSRLSLCIARIHLVGPSGGEAMVYEPDLLLPPEWNRQTVLLQECVGPKLGEVASVTFDLWVANEAGREYKLHLRRCEFLSATQVAAELRTTATPRRRIEPQAQAVPPEDRCWTSFGPGGGGWYRTVAISPHTGDCFLGADVGGIYRSTDGCRSWQIVNAGGEFHLVGHAGSGLPPGGIFNILVDPTSLRDRRTLYAAVTEHGVYKSEDGGMTWQERSAGLPVDSRMPLQLAPDPKDPQRVFLASGCHYHAESRVRSHGYLARTRDAGQHWEVLKRGIEPQCIVVDPSDSRKVYAGNRNFSGVDYPRAFYRSSDGGDTWESFDQTPFLAGPGSPDGDQGVRIFVSCLAADSLHPGVLFAACTDEGYDVSNGRGVFRSVDWGETWKPISLRGLDNLAAKTVVVDPVNPWRLYVGTSGNGFYRFGARAE